MLKCKKCKSTMTDDARFCPNCGRSKKGNRGFEGKQIRRFVFGNYYDDIVPEDAAEIRNRKRDSGMVFKFVLLGFVVVIVLAICITLLVLFGGDI